MTLQDMLISSYGGVVMLVSKLVDPTFSSMEVHQKKAPGLHVEQLISCPTRFFCIFSGGSRVLRYVKQTLI